MESTACTNNECLFAGNASQRVVEAQPETRAMMDLILDKTYTLSVALDGGALVATYPYDKPVQSGNMAVYSSTTYSRFSSSLGVVM